MDTKREGGRGRGRGREGERERGRERGRERERGRINIPDYFINLAFTVASHPSKQTTGLVFLQVHVGILLQDIKFT